MNEKMWGFSFAKSSMPLTSAPIGLSQRPVKLNVGVSVGQYRPEPIYLHTSTGPVEDRL